MEIDWDSFILRVPPGTKVSCWLGDVFDIDEETGREFPIFGGGRCGVLMRFEPEHSLYMPDYFTGEPIQKSFAPSIIVQPYEFVEFAEFYDPNDLHYWIGEQWMTFEKVMTP